MFSDCQDFQIYDSNIENIQGDQNNYNTTSVDNRRHYDYRTTEYTTGSYNNSSQARYHTGGIITGNRGTVVRVNGDSHGSIFGGVDSVQDGNVGIQNGLNLPNSSYSKHRGGSYSRSRPSPAPRNQPRAYQPQATTSESFAPRPQMRNVPQDYSHAERSQQPSMNATDIAYADGDYANDEDQQLDYMDDPSPLPRNTSTPTANTQKRAYISSAWEEPQRQRPELPGRTMRPPMRGVYSSPPLLNSRRSIQGVRPPSAQLPYTNGNARPIDQWADDDGTVYAGNRHHARPRPNQYTDELYQRSELKPVYERNVGASYYADDYGPGEAWREDYEGTRRPSAPSVSRETSSRSDRDQQPDLLLAPERSMSRPLRGYAYAKPEKWDSGGKRREQNLDAKTDGTTGRYPGADASQSPAPYVSGESVQSYRGADVDIERTYSRNSSNLDEEQTLGGREENYAGNARRYSRTNSSQSRATEENLQVSAEPVAERYAGRPGGRINSEGQRAGLVKVKGHGLEDTNDDMSTPVVTPPTPEPSAVGPSRNLPSNDSHRTYTRERQTEQQNRNQSGPTPDAHANANDVPPQNPQAASESVPQGTTNPWQEAIVSTAAEQQERVPRPSSANSASRRQVSPYPHRDLHEEIGRDEDESYGASSRGLERSPALRANDSGGRFTQVFRRLMPTRQEPSSRKHSSRPQRMGSPSLTDLHSRI